MAESVGALTLRLVATAGAGHPGVTVMWYVISSSKVAGFPLASRI
jgi:hypothetical protein